jgi:surface-anchored protein
MLGGLWLVTSPVLWGHVHVQVGYRNGAWDLHVYDFDAGRSEAEDVAFFVARRARQPVPEGERWAFLGVSGQPVSILPQQEVEGVLYLGIGTSGIASGTFQGNRIQLHLRSKEGPGEFSLFTTGSLGEPQVRMSSADDIDPWQDRIELSAVSGHVHVNWAFSAPGRYRLGFSASGVPSGGGSGLESEVVEYTFDVQPPDPPRLGPVRTVPGGGLELGMESDPVGAFTLWSSTDFGQWTRVTNGITPSGRGTVILPAESLTGALPSGGLIFRATVE